MGRIVLAALGSLGSVHPYLAVAGGLKSRGHRVIIAGAETNRPKIEAAGFDFHAVRPELRRSVDVKKGFESNFKNLFRHVGDTYQDLLAACRNADLFLSHPGAFTGPLVGEKLGLPWLSVALAPATLYSMYDPPVLPYAPWLSRIPRLGTQPHSAIFRTFKKFTRKFLKPVDELRAKVGLPADPRHPLFEGMFSPFGTLGWFSNILATPQADWPVHSQITGFPLANDRKSGLDPALESFLNDGARPVVFTLGSLVVQQAGDFYSESLEAVRELGCRAVLLTGSDPRNQVMSPSKSVFVTPYASHAALFPNAAAVVHQGGISTLAEAMSAGVPSLIVPHIHDQYDNAARAAKLGIARTESRGKYQGPRIAAHIQTLLADESYRAQAASVRAKLCEEDGVERACDAIEMALGGRASVFKEQEISR